MQDCINPCNASAVINVMLVLPQSSGVVFSSELSLPHVRTYIQWLGAGYIAIAQSKWHFQKCNLDCELCE